MIHLIYISVIITICVCFILRGLTSRKDIIQKCYDSFNNDLTKIKDYYGCVVKCAGCKKAFKMILDFNNPESNIHTCDCGTKNKIVANISVLTMTDFSSVYSVPVEEDIKDIPKKVIP